MPPDPSGFRAIDGTINKMPAGLLPDETIAEVRHHKVCPMRVVAASRGLAHGPIHPLPFVCLRCTACTRGGGGAWIIRGRISVVQILYNSFVRNLFGVFKDLHGYTLGRAFAHLYHAKGFGE